MKNKHNWVNWFLSVYIIMLLAQHAYYESVERAVMLFFAWLMSSLFNMALHDWVEGEKKSLELKLLMEKQDDDKEVSE